MKKHDDNAYFRCRMNRHWACAFRMPKHFVDLYQASIKGKGKRFETYFAESAHENTNFEVNNALIEDIPIAPINDILFAPVDAKSLDVSNFFNDSKDKTKSPG